MKKESRFERIHNESTMFSSTEIWVDKVTGVNYLYHGNSYGGGLTPLLDREGKPIISPVTYNNNKL